MHRQRNDIIAGELQGLYLIIAVAQAKLVQTADKYAHWQQSLLQAGEMPEPAAVAAALRDIKENEVRLREFYILRTYLEDMLPHNPAELPDYRSVPCMLPN